MISVAAPSTDDRLTELEIKAALAEDMLEALSNTIYRQQQQIEQVQQELRTLRQQMQASSPAEPHSPNDEPPPHY